MGRGRTLLEAEWAERKALKWGGPWYGWGAGRNKSSVAARSNMKRVEQDGSGNYVVDRMGPKRPDEKYML